MGADTYAEAIQDYHHRHPQPRPLQPTHAATKPKPPRPTRTYGEYSAYRSRTRTATTNLAQACLDGAANPVLVAHAVLDAFIPRCEHAIKHPLTALSSVDLDDAGHPLTYRTAISGPDHLAWQDAHAAEWLRLIETSQCITFVPFHAKPAEKRATYYNPQVRIKTRPTGPEMRVRGTAGGDKVMYDGNVSADTASLQTIKLLWNATCSEHANWMTIDIKDFYLGTPMDAPEYMKVSLRLIPTTIQQRYHLHTIARDGHVLARIDKGIYGLPQAGILARQRLVSHLSTGGYYPCPSTPSLFRHHQRDIAFTLVVDDFGIKYQSHQDPKHLIELLQQLYTITVDWEGKKYVGITTTLDREQHTMTLSMPGYVANALKRFGVTKTKADTHSSRVYTPPRFGLHTAQLAPTPDTSPALSPEEVKRIQQIVGVFLFYARAVDATMLYPISKLSSQQSQPTEAMRGDVDRFLQYAATYPDATTVIHPSAMVLRADSDASYLSESGSRSRAGGFWHLSQASDDSPPNAAVDIVCTIIPTVVSSAAEAEYVTLFLNGQKGEPLRNTLYDLGYPQGPTPLKTDNDCAKGIANDCIQQRRTKAILMRYYWVRERVRLGHYRVYWRPGIENLGDYFTKPHPVHHVLRMRPYFVDNPAPSNQHPPTHALPRTALPVTAATH